MAAVGAVVVVVVVVTRPEPVVVAPPPVPENWDGLEPLVSVAAQEALDVVHRAPGSADGWAELAMTYHANDLVDLARPCYEQALALDDTHAPWWFLAARCSAEVGDVAGALVRIDRAIGIETAAWFLYWRKGGWLLESGDVEAATVAFMTAIERGDGIDDPAAWVGLARASLQVGNNEEALQILEPLVGRQPPVPNAEHVANLLGQAYQRLGRGEEAELLLSVQPSRGLTWSDPWSDSMYRRRRFGDWVIRQAHQMIVAGDPLGALTHLAPLAGTHADDPALLKTKGMAHFAVGELDEARTCLERVLESNADDAAAHLNLSYVYERIADWPLALRHIDEAIRLDGGVMQSRVQRGRILLASGSIDLAERALEGVVADNPGRSNPLVWLARARAEAGNVDDASRLLVEAARVNPNDQDIPGVARRIEALKVRR
jgi:tetratricopeptide (TPR) repeat protein